MTVEHVYEQSVKSLRAREGHCWPNGECVHE